jgi:hypothetical protein
MSTFKVPCTLTETIHGFLSAWRQQWHGLKHHKHAGLAHCVDFNQWSQLMANSLCNCMSSPS